MSQLELFEHTLQVLARLGIPHMLVGSYASSFHGEVRSTHDIDLVIDLADEKASALLNAFDRQRYYLSETALRERRLANLIDTLSGDKVDFFFVGDDEVSRREFSRREPARVFSVDAFVSSAEDVILAKLRWNAMMGGSQQQRQDIISILRVRGDTLDRNYLTKYAREQLSLLEELVRQAELPTNPSDT